MYAHTQNHTHQRMLIFGPLSPLGNLFTECWVHSGENLIETWANLMMAPSSKTAGPASAPVRLHLVGPTSNMLPLHFMPQGSMRCYTLIHATLIINLTSDMHLAHSNSNLVYLVFSSFFCASLYPKPLPCLSPLIPTISCRMDITPTDLRRKTESTATMRTLCPKTLRT